jgi:YebC/PmpR family DNA-binding regulatory protein
MSKVFPKLAKILTMAAKEGGPDPESNAKLRMAIANAKAENLPKDNIDAAIKRAAAKDAQDIVEVNYEGKGPHGVLLFIECATDNSNRSVTNIKTYFNKNGGQMAPSGSLDFLFSRKAAVEFALIPGMDLEEIEFALIDGGLEELIEEDGDAIANVFNSTAHLINFQPNGQDTLSRLVSGEKIANIDVIVNPDYVPPTPEPSPTPTPVELASPAPTITPTATATETVTDTTATPIPTPAPKVETPKVETPKVEAPKVDAPKVAAPKAEVKSIDKAPVAHVKVAPIVAPVVTPVVAPIKGKSAPVKELVKVEPLKIVKPEPIKPEPIKLKTDSEPVKAIAPSLTPSTEKAPSAIAPSTAPSNAPPHRKDYLKDIGFTQKKVFSSHKTEVPTTPEDAAVTTPEAKATENAPVLTDLSATTSTPIKVLTKSSN